MKKRKLIMDVDTGSDDALALMSAVLSPEAFELVGVCAVGGNLPVENTTENTLRVLELLHADHIPVIAGAAVPLIADLDPSRRVRINVTEAVDDNGETVAFHSDLLPIPAAKGRALEGEYAATWMIRTLLASEEKITLILTGPLTDLALAYRIEPKIVEHIDEIVIMGGGVLESNATPAAEFNIFADPEAAAIVFTLGNYVPLTVMPLDATYDAYLCEKDALRLDELHNAVGDFAATEIRERVKAYNYLSPIGVPDVTPIHDALCVLYLLEPELITKKETVYAEIVCGGAANGQILIDRRIQLADPANATICLATDTERFSDLICSIFERSKDLI